MFFYIKQAWMRITILGCFLYLCSTSLLPKSVSNNVEAASVILLQLEKPKGKDRQIQFHNNKKGNSIFDLRDSNRGDDDPNRNSNNNDPSLTFSRVLRIKPKQQQNETIDEDHTDAKIESSPLTTYNNNVTIRETKPLNATTDDAATIDIDRRMNNQSILDDDVTIHLYHEPTTTNDKASVTTNPTTESTIVENHSSFDLYKKTKPKLLVNGLFAMNFPRSPKLLRNFLQRNVRSIRPHHPASLLIGATVIGALTKVVTSEAARRSMYFWIHAGPIIAHYKFAKWWMRLNNVERHRRDNVFNALHNRYCQKSLNIILQLKGLYVKMGQILSSRPDFVPKQYIEVFAELQDSVPQAPVEDVVMVIRKSLKDECGLDYDEVFEYIDPIALGSASIGQVHKATVRESWAKRSGRADGSSFDVAIKVMHPGAKGQFTHDFQVFRWLCRITLPGWESFLTVLENQIMTEFDYRKEALSLQQVRRNMANSIYATKVRVPEPYIEMCSREVLVMEYLQGKRLIDSIEEQLANAFGGSDQAAEFLTLKRAEVMTGSKLGSSHLIRSTSWYGKYKLLSLVAKCRNIIDLLVSVHGHQIFIDGCWNGDPHAGNFLLLDDGRIGLIDYGQTKRINDIERLSIAKIIIAIADGAPARTIADHMRNAGFGIRYPNDEMLKRYAKLFFDSDEDGLKEGWVTPQHYFASLMFSNPLTSIPDAAVFVGRASFLFRGFGHAIGAAQVKTSSRWSHHARQALADAKG